jgi:hypothetical protein
MRTLLGINYWDLRARMLGMTAHYNFQIILELGAFVGLELPCVGITRVFHTFTLLPDRCEFYYISVVH